MIEARRYLHDIEGSEPVAPDALAAAVDAKKGLLWVDCREPSDEAVDAVAAQFGITHLAAEDLRHGRQRTKLDHYGDHYHVAVHDCVLADGGLVDREIDIVFGDGWLVSVTQPAHDGGESGEFPMSTVARRFETQRLERGETDEGFLLWALLDVIVDRYFDLTDRVDGRIDETEDLVFSETTRGTIPRGAFDLRRDLVAFRRLVAPLREVLSEVARREVGCVGEMARTQLQDVYDHVLRVADIAESQRELVAGLFEANLAVQSNRMNQVMKRMTSWGAILLGATLIAGIYGMNFRHMPELDWTLGYPMALSMMAALTVILVVYFRRRDYL